MARICDICGKNVSNGMTDDEFSFYTHEKCFSRYMDKTYGKHRWMRLGKDIEDEFGGYYIITDDNNPDGYSGTGIFFTEFSSC